MTMKTKYILKALFITFLTFTVVGCGYDTEVIEELAVNREFAPVALTARVRNQTIVELNWTVDDNIDHYVVEFSADDPDFNNIFKSLNIDASELPVQVALEGETVYSIRVKAISARGLDESKWSLIEAITLTEQIMLPAQPGDIGPTYAILRWIPNSNVTQIVLQPGDIIHDITSQEKTDGVATVNGLTGETEYTALLLNNTKTRGSAIFTTGIDVGDNTLVLPTDDLFAMIAAAAPGDILLLEQGDYTSQTGTITLDKSITIQGLRTDFKPLLKVAFNLIEGAADVNLIDLDLMGDVALGLTDVVELAVGNFNTIMIRGCNIHDYDKSLIKGQTLNAIVQSLTIENCIVTNILTNSSDFIDFRDSDVLNLNITTSTFNNCAPGRDFIRMDAAGTSNAAGLTSNVVLDRNTIYACSNSTSRRIFYIRFVSNDVTSSNNLIAETLSEGYADRLGIDETPTFDNNNYFNAPGFYDTAQYIYDSGNFTILDPAFVDALTGNFKVTNQTLIDNNVGDPRWLQ